MLVLSRKLGEKIYIGEDVCITIVDVHMGKVRVGIEAPRDKPICRDEFIPHCGHKHYGVMPEKPT